MPDRDPGNSTNLVVALRVRPLSSSEFGDKEIIHVLDNNLVVLRDPNEDQDDILRINRSREKQYVFDHSFGPMATQNEVYSVTTKPLIESVVTGYNATVFAYGATGAGKTYTMLGSDNRPGIMGLTLNDLFAQMESTKEDVKYKVTMSYLEIYNEMIRDLLNPASGILELREDAKGVNVAGLSDVEASTTSEVMSMLLMGNKQRTSEPTAANKTSSRSHAVLQVTVRQKSRVENVIQEVKIGKLFMIDLAGSERAAQTKNRGKRMIEGAHINRSLLALGNCINALSENRGHYVNFRDSKLTRLLKDSLGGNCKTVMIAHVSPAGKGFEESRNTLLYADRAKNIKTTIKRNQFNVSYHIAQYTSIIADLRKEIFRLKTKIEEQTVAEPDNNSKRDDEQYKNRDHTEMTKIRNELVSTFREQMEIRHKLMELEDVAMQIAIDTNRYMLVIDEWEQEKARRISKAVSASKDEVVDIHHDDDLLESPDEQRDKNGKRIWPKDDENEKDLTADPSIEDFDNKDLYEKEKEGDGGDVFSLTSVEEPEEVTFAKEEIDNLVAEEKRVTEMKANLQNRLVQTRKEIERLEELMPQKISGEENREILGLILKVHELEISNAELQSQALLRENVLRYKDLEVSKYESRQKLCDDIIQMQRAAITDAQINCSSELQALYDVYQQHPSDVEDRDSVSSARSGSQVSLSASTVSLNRAAVLAGINRRMTSRENVFTFTSKLSPLTEETPSRMVSLQNSPTKRSRPTPPVVNTVIENDTPEISTPNLRPSRASSPDMVTVIKEPNNETFQPSTPVFSKTQKFTDLTARRRMIIDINTGSSSSLRNDDVISSKVSVRDSDRDSLRDRPIASYSESNLALNGSKSTVKSSQSMTDLSIIDNKASDDVSVDSVPITRKKSKKSRVEPAKISSRSIKRQRSASLDDVKVHKAKSRQHRKSQLPETNRNRTKHHQIPSKVRDRMSLGNDESSPSNNYKPVRERVSLGMEDPSPSSNARAKRSTHLPKSHHPDFSLRTRRDPIKQTTKLPHNDWNDGELQSFQSNMTPPSTVHQIGTPPGKGLTIHKRHRAPSDITGSDSNQSTPRLRPRRYTNHANPSSMDGLSISGHAVRPSKQFGGSRRF